MARWFKEMLSILTTDRIFLDSDELDRLDLIFNVVDYDTCNLVGLLTTETLFRMWWAGEMTSAYAVTSMWCQSLAMTTKYQPMKYLILE